MLHKLFSKLLSYLRFFLYLNISKFTFDIKIFMFTLIICTKNNYYYVKLLFCVCIMGHEVKCTSGIILTKV